MLQHLGEEITIDDVTYPIGHLVPFFHTLPGVGIDGADLRVRISFSCHVFSEKALHNEQFDMRDQNESPRRFDRTRYDRSLTLPNDVRTLLDSNGVTWEMKDHNNIENMAALTDVPDLKVIKGTFDVILYYLYPSQAEHFDVEMNVLTCHVRSVNTESKHKLDMRQALRTCIYSRERLPMTAEKRRTLALERAAENAAKKKAKLEKRKLARGAKP
jgi:hypothetical protein